MTLLLLPMDVKARAAYGVKQRARFGGTKYDATFSTHLCLDPRFESSAEFSILL
jgi:hypothetical protein